MAEYYKISELPKDNHVTKETTIGELANNFGEWMVYDDNKAEGFTVGDKGQKIHWYLDPSPSGFYYVFPKEPPHISPGGLGYRRGLEVDHKVIIHYINED